MNLKQTKNQVPKNVERVDKVSIYASKYNIKNNII